MKVNLPIYYNQMDSVWAYLLLGYNTASNFNFYNYACLITCLAMIARYYGRAESPVTINQKLKETGGYVAGGGLYIHGSFQKLFPDIIEKRTKTPDLLSDNQLNEIRQALSNKFPVMVQIDYNPTTVLPDQHFVIFTDFNPNDENDFTIIDPIGGKMKSLKEYLKQPIDSVRETIMQYIILEGLIPVDKKSTMTVEIKDWEKALKAMGNIERVGDYLGYSREIVNSVGFGDVVVDKIKSIQTSYNQLNDSINKNPLKDGIGFVPVDGATANDNSISQPQSVLQANSSPISPSDQAVAFYDKDIFAAMLSGISKFMGGITWKK